MDTQSTSQGKKKSKKEVRQTVYEKLAAALADYKAQLKSKKFENNLRKASKLFAADISRANRLNGHKKKDKKKKETTPTEKTSQ